MKKLIVDYVLMKSEYLFNYFFRIAFSATIILAFSSVLLHVQGTELESNNHGLSVSVEEGYEDRLEAAKVYSKYEFTQNRYTTFFPRKYLPMKNSRLKVSFKVWPNGTRPIRINLYHNNQLKYLDLTSGPECDASLDQEGSYILSSFGEMNLDETYSLELSKFSQERTCHVSVEFRLQDTSSPKGKFVMTTNPVQKDLFTLRSQRVAIPPDQYSCTFQCYSLNEDNQVDRILFQENGKINFGAYSGTERISFSTTPLEGGRFPQLRFEVWLILFSVALPIIFHFIWNVDYIDRARNLEFLKK